MYWEDAGTWTTLADWAGASYTMLFRTTGAVPYSTTLETLMGSVALVA